MRGWIVGALMGGLVWLLAAHGLSALAQGHQHDHHATGGSFFSDLLKVYTPRQVCMNNEGSLVWLHLVSDLLIALAYYSIPIGLVYFVRKRRDLSFNWVFVMFAAFILACGTTHVFGIIALWTPVYRLDGIVKLITAILSVGTAIALWPLIPKALSVPSLSMLEQRVRERTAELDATNQRLKEEIAQRVKGEAAQARLAAIVESSADAILGKDLLGTVVAWNTGAQMLFGYSAQEIIGKGIQEIIPPDRRAEEAQILDRLRRGEQINLYETKRLTKDGRLIDVAITASPIRDVQGQITGVSKIARDITQQKRARIEREQLLESEKQARSEAERASRMKDEFLATLSHELRTPLNAILGYAQILGAEKGVTPEISHGLDVIVRNSRLQARLIEDLLDMSRIVSGKLTLDVQCVDLHAVLSAAVASIEPAASAKNIVLERVSQPKACMVTGDPARLQQVFWNLLTNAIKFTPKGGKVEVTLLRVNSHIELAVADNGEGIDPQLLPHLFIRFQQGDSSSTRRHGGLGLGLAIVRHLVELHGGSVRAESAGPGKGSRFTVLLPVRAAHGASSGDACDSSTMPQSLPSLQGIKTLIVDDEADAVSLLERILAGAGATVLKATSSAEGFEAFSTHRPDVLLSDIGMPGEDGYGLIRRVRQLPIEAGGQTPAVALTAFARPEDRARAMLAGFQMHVSKPVEPAELVAVVANLAGRLGSPASA